MVWAYHREVAAVECRDVGDVQAFGCGDDRGVHCAQGQVAITRDEFGDAQPVLAATGSMVNAPPARSPRNRTSGSVPRRVASRSTTSVITRVETMSGPGCVWRSSSAAP